MDISHFKDLHKDEKILILGCGTSVTKLKEIKNYNKIITIGVNDIGRFYDPTYLMVVDHPAKFEGIRYKVVHNTTSKYVFTQLKSWKIKDMSKLVKFTLGTKFLATLDEGMLLDYSNNSPFIAIILAHKMGANHIGMLGIDFTDDHFYAKDGKHNLVSRGYVDRIDKDYKVLYTELKRKGTIINNLSTDSLIKSIPQGKLSDFNA